LRQVRTFFAASQSSFVVIVALSVINAALLIPVPLVVRYILDVAVPSERTTRIVVAGSLLIALMVGSEILILIRRNLTARHGKDAIQRLRHALLLKLHNVPVDYHRRSEPAELHDNIVVHTATIDTMVQSVLSTVVPTFILLAGIAGVMLSINWIVFIETLLVIPLIYAIYRVFQPLVQHAEDDYDTKLGALSDSVIYTLRSIELTRSRGAEAVDMARNDALLAETRSADVDARRARGVYRTLERSALAVFAVVILVTLGIESARGRITIGEVFSFFAALGILILPVTLTFAAVPATIDGLAALKEVTDFLGESGKRPYRGTKITEKADQVSLTDVTFSYGSEPVLTKVSLDLEPGTVTMISGPNGSGKSSIVDLLLGFFRPNEGVVSAGGSPYDDLDMRSLRQHFGFVAQEPIIVAGTISDNIKYGAPEASDPQLWQAAHLSTVDDFIVDFEEGYEHTLGFGGRTLSAGQRQRIAIARALIRAPQLLILDEPTSYLDVGTLSRVIANLARLKNRPTVLVTSHRPRVIDTIDRLYRIEGRRLIEDTSPDDD
jgi:ATP-binding cassette subfamily B protein